MNLPAVHNQKFIDAIKSTKLPSLDTQGYGITTTPVPDPSQPHWRIIGIHHLTGAENHSQHHLFVDVLDKSGERIKNSQVIVHNHELPPAILTLDKPLNEPGTNTQMYFNDTLSISVDWDGLPSETASGFHTRHEDDDPPGSTRGHHSYYIVFQKSAGVTEQPPLIPVPDMPPNGTELEAELLATGQPFIQALNRNAALFKVAQAQGLGQRLTGEYELMHDGQTYIAQIFEMGLVYVPDGQWDQVQVVDTSTREVTAFGPSHLWDNHITGFFGNRSQYWEWYLRDSVPGLGWIEFKNEVITQNPVLEEDAWVFKADKIYKMPRSLHQPAAPAHAPVTMPAIPPEPIEPIDPNPPVPKSIFVQARNGHFYINDKPRRFMGVNIRGLVHYGQDPHYFRHAPAEHRDIQLQGAKDMNVRLVRVFLAHKDATPQEIEGRLRDTLNVMKAKFPDIYLLPALTNLYKDVPFYVKGDEKFYNQPSGNREILNNTFYEGGYEENYLPFVRHMVTAFKDEPQIFAWEIGNELKAENAPDVLVNFMTSVAAKIKTWDPNHMVTTGMISTRHAFMEHRPELRDKLYGSNHIDFITIHPYNGNEPPHPVENDSDLARKFKKPIVIEEAGFDRTHYPNRPEKTRSDLAYWFGEGASCYMPWGFVKTPHDNNDGDSNVGLTGPLHNDFNQLCELHRQCGELLGNAKITDDVRPTIAQFGFSTRDVESMPLAPIIVDGFDFPVGKPDAGGYYVAAGLVDPAYHANLGYWHTGEDWNGVRGQDTDLGDPVFAIAHGQVITSYVFPTWGNIVLIEHVLPTGDKVWSQYAHLKDRLVEKGAIVRRGDLIGTIGKGANNKYIAHLHFEIRRHNLPASKWWKNTPTDREQILRAYVHPTNFINNFRPR